MKKILLIGGKGYIGSELYLYLKNKYYISSVDLEWFGNFTDCYNINQDYNNLSQEFINKYDVVILLAGHSSVGMCGEPTSVLKNNVFNFINLLEKLNNEQLFIYASSSSVYGNTSDKIVDEHYNLFNPFNYYDLSKYEIDAYAKLSKKYFYALRFGTVNGPSPNFRTDIMINAMTYNALKEKKIYCFNPTIQRPILGILDLCRSIETIIKNGTYEKRGIYNIASFNSTSENIAKKVADLTNSKLEIVDTIPDKITNIKLQTNAYNFTIDSSLFEKNFDFKFTEDADSIILNILKRYSGMNKDGRTQNKIYK